MNKRIKKQWVKALRSGQYDQAQGQLLRIDEDDNCSFCCWGVLCDIYARSKVGREKNVGFNWEIFIGAKDNCKYMPTKDVMEWADIKYCKINGKGLGSWNDSGKDFNFIADLIEENL